MTAGWTSDRRTIPTWKWTAWRGWIRTTIFQGSLTGTLSWKGIEFGAATAYAQYVSDGDESNDYIIARGEKDVWGYTLAKSIEVNLNTGEIDWFPDREVVDQEIVLPPAASKELPGTTKGETAHGFDIPP